MAEKQKPIGVCDLCGGSIPRSMWYTSKGRPRLHCSLEHKNTANSRAGAPIRSKKARVRVATGQWRNPAKLHPPDPANVAAGVRIARRREVSEKLWRNPALSEEARRKLSRPRKHRGALHRAIEKLRRGSMSDLTPAEHRAHLTYRQQLRQARRQELNRQARERYRQQQANLTPAEREAQRLKWRQQNQRKSKRRRK